eukprot:scpid46494/ scgid20336/ Sushi, von Willebrand factor type A, EGF and pentraxin domain-containing protein 1; Polydom
MFACVGMKVVSLALASMLVTQCSTVSASGVTDCQLPSISNAMVVSISSPQGALPGQVDAIVECNIGYKLDGGAASANIKCIPNSLGWNPPSCSLKTCGRDPVAPQYGSVANGSMDVFTSRQYSCDSGYRLVGLTSTVCLATQSWLGPEPTCIRSTCKKTLVAPQDGQIANISVEIFGTTSFECDDGFMIVGSRASVCLPSETWSHPPPTCTRIECPSAVPTVINGMVIGGGHHVTNVRKIVCNAGYRADGPDTLVCQPNGTWSHSTPSCKRNVCGALPGINYASIQTAAGPLVPGSTAFIKCNEGYELRGGVQIVCDSLGRWNTNITTCERITCSDLSAPSNGSLQSTGPPYFLSVRNFKCSSGYELLGHPSTVCQSNGKWSRPSPSCKLIQCDGGPVPPGNGSVVIPPSPGKVVGSVRHFRCREGFVLNGHSYSFCQSNKKWSKPPTTCNPHPCLAPYNISNAVIRPGQQPYVYLNTLTVDCDPGYEGGGEIQCEKNGFWSTVTCDPTECPKPNNPENGRVFVENAFFGSVANFVCDAGFFLDGSSNITCKDDRSWTSHQPRCEPVTCPTLTAPGNGAVSKGAEDVDAIRRFSCNPGYKLIGHSTVVCQLKGQWSWSAPTCQYVPTAAPTTPAATTVPTTQPSTQPTTPATTPPGTPEASSGSSTVAAGAIGFVIALACLGLAGGIVYLTRLNSAKQQISGSTKTAPVERRGSTMPLTEVSMAQNDTYDDISALRSQYQLKKAAGGV